MNWKAGLQEFDRRLDKFINNIKIQILVGLYFLCDILPYLPDALAEKIINKILNILGLGE